MSTNLQQPTQMIHLPPRVPRWAPMKSWLLSFIIFNFSLLIFHSCGLDVEDPTPPSPPQWVQKSLPEEWPERGIDAHESGGIFLEWVSNPVNENIASYHIYRAQYFEIQDSVGSFVSIARLDAGELPKMEYIDVNPTRSIMMKYIISAENSSGICSEFSDIISYTLLEPIDFGMMWPNRRSQPLAISRILGWRNFYLNEVEIYILTLMYEDNRLVSRVVLQPENYFSGEENWQIPDSIHLEPEFVYKWRIDVGSKIIHNQETAGSESFWAAFLYVSP